MTLWDQQIAACNEDNCDVGVFFFNGNSCTIMLPPEIRQALPIEANTFDLPADVEAKVVGHEWLHCRGKDHVYTSVGGSLISRPSGHIMHPSVFLLGWRTEGL